MTFSPHSSYIPLSSPDTVSLIERLTQQGLPADEAVTQVACLNHEAKQRHQPATVILNEWLERKK